MSDIRFHNCPIGLFLTKIEIVPSGCWEWQAPLNAWGYGNFTANNKQVLAHRFSYEASTGSIIPEGLEIDHLCRNTKCVNPAHLEVVTGRENRLRGTGFVAIEAAKTHCPKGHPYSPENTYINKNKRYCKTCGREDKRRRYQSKYQVK